MISRLESSCTTSLCGMEQVFDWLLLYWVSERKRARKLMWTPGKLTKNSDVLFFMRYHRFIMESVELSTRDSKVRCSFILCPRSIVVYTWMLSGRLAYNCFFFSHISVLIILLPVFFLFNSSFAYISAVFLSYVEHRQCHSVCRGCAVGESRAYFADCGRKRG